MTLHPEASCAAEQLSRQAACGTHSEAVGNITSEVIKSNLQEEELLQKHQSLPLHLIGLAEDSTLEPTNPYSAAKAGAEMIAKAYMTSYRLPVITTRSNNVYGPKQFPEKLIGKFTLLATRNEDLPIHGNGEPACQACRCFCAIVGQWSQCITMMG